jgi:creatinine amidohydrolase/Fe(II)-dependent formamide hydrolase-like protein
MAHATVEAIARELGNAIFLPVLPYTPNDAESIPGTIGITNELLAAMLERITEQAVLNGFHNVILMGDHAGGQPQVYDEVANKLNARYGALRVFYCDQVYRGAQRSGLLCSGRSRCRWQGADRAAESTQRNPG